MCVNQIARLESLAGLYRPAAPVDPTGECLRLIANFEHERRGMMSDETMEFLADLTRHLTELREEHETRHDFLERITTETAATQKRIGEDFDEARIDAKRRLDEGASELDRKLTKLTREDVLVAAIELAETAIADSFERLHTGISDRLDTLAGDLKGRV